MVIFHSYVKLPAGKGWSPMTTPPWTASRAPAFLEPRAHRCRILRTAPRFEAGKMMKIHRETDDKP